MKKIEERGKKSPRRLGKRKYSFFDSFPKILYFGIRSENLTAGKEIWKVGNK